MEATQKQVEVFKTPAGWVPFIDWLRGLRDQRARQKIQARIDRLSLGNLGNSRSVGEGVQELKIDYGPGYRVYFGQHGEKLVILLCGGDKGTQDEDIEKAKEFWKAYKEEKSHANR